MKILALEFSTAQRSVAVRRTPRADVAGPDGWCEAIRTGPPATPALEMIETVLHEAGLEREQVEVVAVALGPGSYVGIRQAIALAQGWQLARDIKLLGVSSADCLAAQAHTDGVTGVVHVVLDAQRTEFYLATYHLTPTTWQQTESLRLASLEAVRAQTQSGGLVISPDSSRWFPSSRQVFPCATMIGQLAATRTDFVSAEQLEPIYLRETSFVKAPPPRVW
jgi:tRNA threonylcarbamoyladenosine biosynthesis protein TsaB